MGLGGAWQEVKKAYEKIATVYERANKIVTFGNVDKWRKEAVSLFYRLNGASSLKVLDAGAGPGNMAAHLRNPKYVVALDATLEMLYVNNTADDKVLGLFEYMPFRNKAFDVVVAGYSLHVAANLEKPVAEFNRVADYQVVVSIGKPDNSLIRILLYLYIRFIAPLLVCIITRKDICREYKKIYVIIKSLPPNTKFREVVSKKVENLIFQTRGLGGVYIYVAKSS
ncbi:MAG: methyltransferase domain-containing protein [Pyrobaculum sp.]